MEHHGNKALAYAEEKKQLLETAESLAGFKNHCIFQKALVNSMKNNKIK